MAFKTIKTNPNKPPCLIAYGPEGVGKTSLGAFSDKPIFIAPEGGADQITDANGNVIQLEMMPDCNSWDGITKSVDTLINQNHNFQTVVLDSADWIEKLAHKKILGNGGRSIATVNGGYGAGYAESENMHRILIEKLTNLRDKKNMGIVVVAHAQIKEVKDPHATENYDAYDIKCHHLVSALWREWVYAVLFINFNTYIKKADEKKNNRAFSDDRRSMYARNDPAFKAKNRYGMPKELPFEFDAWDVIKSYALKNSPQQIQSNIVKLLASVQDTQKKSQILDYTQKMAGNVQALTEARNRVQEIINEQNGGN